MQSVSWVAVRRALPIVLYSIVLFVLSAQERLPEPDLGIVWQDKIFHAAAYTVYGWLTLRALSVYHIQPYKRTIIAIALGVVFAFSDELHQYYVPGRHADVWDWVADCVGIALAIVVSRTTSFMQAS